MKRYRIRTEIAFEVEVPDDVPAGRAQAERHILELWYALAEEHPEIAAGSLRVKTVQPLTEKRA